MLKKAKMSFPAIQLVILIEPKNQANIFLCIFTGCIQGHKINTFLANMACNLEEWADWKKCPK